MPKENTDLPQNPEDVISKGNNVKTYRVQLFAAAKGLTDEHPVYSVFSEIYTETSRGLTRVLTEETTSEKEAKKFQAVAQMAGYKDAYIVVYIDGIRQ